MIPKDKDYLSIQRLKINRQHNISVCFCQHNGKNLIHFHNNRVIMNESQDEGFYQPPVQTFTQNLLKQECNKHYRKSQSFKIRPVLSVHHQIPLYQYPSQLDIVNKISVRDSIIPLERRLLDSLVKSEEEQMTLSDYFPRNLQCVYNKFQEKLIFKRDLTLIIRNTTRQTRDEQLNTFTSPRQEQKQNLNFSSNFQCGNLHFVFKEHKRENYYLLLQNDINTHGFNFWFYFNIRSIKSQRANFIIVNLSRFVSFEGEISIVTYTRSKKQFQRKVGFITTVSKFCRCDNEQSYWSLLFQYQFEQQSDTYFCLTLPYSYSKIIKFVKSLGQLNSRNYKVVVESAAKSPLGNIIPLINIVKDKFIKKIIFITARQHPCQTVASFACESLVRKLCDQSALSQALLQNYRFIIIPMVNVDGVIHGNSRTNLMGYDLNRSWDRTGIVQSIECEQIWNYLQRISHQGEIIWSFDLHGHSRQHGFFAYFSQQNDKNLIMTHLLSSKSSYFRANKCVYQIGVSKRSSLRSQLYYKMKITNSVTIQISLYGFYDSNKQFVQFQLSHFDQMATALLQSLLQTEKMSNKKISKLYNVKEIIKKMEKKTNAQEQDSDPDPQGDYLKNQQREQVQNLGLPKDGKKYSEPKILQSKSKGVMHRSRLKTDISKMSAYTTQKIYPLKNQLIQGSSFLKIPSSEQKRKATKRQIYNITLSNRSRSYHKTANQSQEIHNKLKMINIGQKQAEDAVYKKGKNNLIESSQNLKKSLDMRKRIRLALDNRLKTDRGAYMTNLVIKPSQQNNIKVFIYPEIKYKQKEKGQRQESDITKLRNKSFVTSLYSRFHNSFYCKIKNQ